MKEYFSGHQKGRYLAKSVRIFGHAVDRGRSETVSSPSDTGDLDHSVYHMHYSTGEIFFFKAATGVEKRHALGKNLVRISIFSPDSYLSFNFITENNMP